MEIEREYQRSLNYIYSFIDLSITRNLRYSPDKFDLSRMYRVMSLLGDPQFNYDVVHVAGTKGKGSICAMTASIMREAGYKVGFYSSPHMIDFRERIKVNNIEISRQSINNYVIKLRPIFNSVEKISTFEIITAIAFKYFADQQLDIAVIEVGMGGRLDATNVVQPIVSIISPVSHDHMKILGNTIAKIAKEKAGIIKKSIPVILSPQKISAIEEIKIIAKRKGSLIIDTSEKYTFEQIDYSLEKQSFIIKELGYEINESALKNGFTKVEWPGRFEVVCQKPLIIVDGAHNRDSFRKIRNTIKKYLTGKKVTLIFGASEDKEVKLMLKIIKPYIEHFVFTKSGHPRALKVEKIEKIALNIDLNNYSISEIDSIIPLILRKSNQEKAYIASGSIFIAGAIKQLFSERDN
jgi:dihydrofolate synthase/folylpolyglutamate synthase